MNETDLTTESALRSLTGPLLAWYRANARDLPWRRTEDPYRIWVSEIMLQQTRVAAVVDHYRRFLAEFPTLRALAAAPEERLMKLWEGLGYYSRARNLQKAARLAVQVHGGQLPADFAALRALPGIGDYTAAAVASAAFGLAEPAVDGNVLRVYARLRDCHDDIADPAVKKTVRAALSAVMPAGEEARIFNQAYMELGATVCPPKGPPRCGTCPAAALCLGRERGTAAALPVKRAKKPRRQETWTVFVLLRAGRVALRRRGDGGLLAGLWEFPSVPGALEESDAAAAAAHWGLEVCAWRNRLAARHIFTHVEWEMTGYTLEVAGPGAAELVWVDAAGLRERAVPSAFARYYAEAAAILDGASADGGRERSEP